VLDGELVSWDTAAGRTSFSALQRRVTAGRGLSREAAARPASLVCFDLLADPDHPDGELLALPLAERRARLESSLAGAPTAVPVCPQTTDLDEASRWLSELAPTGIEGLL
jgi:ATP-dependent DNA ligase